jgi:hypothetical protein
VHAWLARHNLMLSAGATIGLSFIARLFGGVPLKFLQKHGVILQNT